MNWIVAMMLTLLFKSAPAAGRNKTPQAWNARTIEWQQTDPDGSKWAVLEGHSDVPGEAFTVEA